MTHIASMSQSDRLETVATFWDSMDSEHRYRCVKETAGVVVLCLTPDGRILDWNRTAEQIYGYQREEVLGKSYIDLFLPEEVHRAVADDMAAVLSGEPTEGFENEVINRHGETRALLWNVTRLLDGERKPAGLIAIGRDITERRRHEQIQASRNEVLERLSRGAPLGEILLLLVRTVEESSTNLFASVLLLDDQKKCLHHGAAPSLPDFYNEAIDGVEIGPYVGSCGAAASTGKRVVVEDVMTHPNWVHYRQLAERAGLRACWSEPISASNGEILGTFALYYSEPRSPAPEDLQFITTTANLAGIAIERTRGEQ